jgi:hypothetical protein
MVSDFIHVTSCLLNFVIEEDGDVHTVTRDSDEGEQIDPMEGGLRNRPSNVDTTGVHENSIRRIRFVNEIKEANLLRPVMNIERNATGS